MTTPAQPKWQFGPLLGVTSTSSSMGPPTHYGSGIITRSELKQDGSGGRLFITCDDGGGGAETFAWVDFESPTKEDKYNRIAKAKWRAILESIDDGKGGQWLSPAVIDQQQSSNDAWVIGKRAWFGIVARGEQEGKYDEVQFMPPARVQELRASGATPTRTPYTRDMAGGGHAGGAAPAGGGFVAPALPAGPTGGPVASPVGAPAMGAPPAGPAAGPVGAPSAGPGPTQAAPALPPGLAGFTPPG